MSTTDIQMGEPKKVISRAAPRSKGKGLIAALIFVLLLLFCVGGFSAWALTLYNQIYPGVHIGDVDVSGKSMDEARVIAEKMDAEKYRQKTLKLKVGSHEYDIATDDLEAGIDAEKTANTAYNVGRTGSVTSRIGDIIGAAVHGRVVEPDFKISSVKFAQRVSEIKADVEEFLTSPYELRENTIVIRVQNMPDQIDERGLSEFLLTRLHSADFSGAEYQIKAEGSEKVNLAKIFEEVKIEPKNASLDLAAAKDGSVILKHVTGRSFDLESAKSVLSKATGKTIELPLIFDEPEFTTERFTSLLFRDTLSEVSTNLNPGLVSRTSNVRLAAKNTNGVILNPGDEYSFNKAVGKRLPETGFGEAKVFEKGEIVDGIGGGICQVSSTIYMASLRADLKIAERRNHQFVVSYTPLGQDATVVYGNTDFRFVNNTKMPIKLFTEQKGSKMYATIYGTAFENKKVEFQTTVLEKTPYETKTIYDDTLEYGKKEVVSDGHTGYKTVTYRIVTVNGIEVSREKENASTYTKLDFVTKIGTKNAPANAIPTVKQNAPGTTPSQSTPSQSIPSQSIPS